MGETNYDFGHALAALNRGERVSRSGWNGRGMWLKRVSNWQDNALDLVSHPPTLPFIAMSTVDGSLVPWLASQTDILSEDWGVVGG